MKTLRIGRFSRSPVLAAARHWGWDSEAGIALEEVPATSSPAQFQALREGAIDVALTSPDNVLLYATTDRNPLGERLPIRLRRAVDGGLGLALVSRPEIASAADLARAAIAVDVLPSGFAMLLKALLARQGVDPAAVTYVEEGGTPRRAERLLDGAIGATILNAESRVRAEGAGMTTWATSADISPDYPGTVIAVLGDPDIQPLLDMWDRATAWLLESSPEAVLEMLAQEEPELADPAYVALATSPETGLRREPGVTEAQLSVLVELRQEAGAYAPADADLRALATA